MTALMTLYHNPRCSKSRAALQLLEQAGHAPELRLYLQEPFSKSELQSVLKKLGMQPRELLRSGEAAYKELGLADASLPDARLIDAMLQEPKLIQRPIAVLGAEAVIGRPPEAVLELLA